MICLAMFCPRADAQVMPLRTYSIENGLSESVVNHITQDDKGYIWVATEFGLNRLDGITIENYFAEDGLNNNKLRTLHVDSQGRLWIGSDSGVNYLSEGIIQSPQNLEVLKNSSVLSILEDSEGNFWFGTDGNGAWLLDNQQTLTQYTRINGLANDRVRDIVEDKEGTIWFGTRNGLTSLKDGNFRTYSINQGMVDEKVRDLMISSDEKLLIGTRAGLSIFDDGTFTNITEKDGLVNNRIQSITQDKNGGLYIGTEEGLSYYQNGTFTNYETDDGLSNQFIVTVFNDDQNGTWLGSFGGGVYYYSGLEISNFSIDNGLKNNMISSIVSSEQVNGNTLVGTYGAGIAVIADSVTNTITESDGLINNKVYTMMPDSRGRLWIGTRWGLSIYEDGKFENYGAEVLPERKIRTIHERQTDGTIWLGTLGGGLMIMENGSFSSITKSDGLANNTVRDIEEDAAGRLWIATFGGVNMYENGSFQTISLNDGLPNNGVNDIEIDSHGNKWFATYSGFVKYSNGKLTVFDKTNGMSDEVCYFIREQEPGIFWIGTNKGLIRFNERVVNDPAVSDTSQAFQTYTTDQGLISNELNTQAIHIEGDYLWAGTVGGVSKFSLSTVTEEPYKPPLYITGLSLFNTSLPLKDNLELESGQNFLTVHFTGIDYRAPDQVTYEYRLKGADQRWIKTKQRRVQYAALPAGEYTFQVRAKNFFNNWSEQVKAVHFTIIPPFWQRWWFYLLIAVGVIGIILFFYHYYRINKMIELERVRVQIASDLHDDVGASLTEIALQTDFLQTTNKDSEMNSMLKDIGQISRNVVSSLDDIVWTIDARNDTIGDLTDRMQDYANHVFGKRDVQVTYRFEDADMSCKMPVEERENIYLIFKESMNNIAKHSKADHVWVRLKYQNDGFKMVIKDNGSGSNQMKELKGNGNVRKSGHGLMNMKMRSKRIGAKLNIKQENGFEIEVEKTDGDKKWLP